MDELHLISTRLSSAPKEDITFGFSWEQPISADLLCETLDGWGLVFFHIPNAIKIIAGFISM